MSGMNWRRVHYEARSLRFGTANVADEKDALGRDRAAQWLAQAERRPRVSDPYYRTSHWLKLRAAALKRDRNTCTVPGCHQRATYVDHIVPRKQGGADALHNLRSLCAMHDNQIRQDASGKRRSGGILRGCHADGSPVDPNHPWHKA